MSPPRPTTPPRPPPTSSRPTNRPTSSSKPTTATTSISFPHFAGELSSKGHGVRGDVILLTDSRLLIHRCVPKHLFSTGVCTQLSCLDFGTTGQRQGSHSSQAPPQNGRHLLVSPSQWQRITPLRSRCESMIINRSGCVQIVINVLRPRAGGFHILLGPSARGGLKGSCLAFSLVLDVCQEGSQLG